MKKIAKAQARGKHCGRTSKLSKEQMGEIRRRSGEGEEKKALAIEFGISRQTLYRIIKV
ncbi:helix-turn-helix domain-containing protein [Pseudodesulfovibrio thermohalotolerans]|uniref:helix-turn-helix domain-containing protein n=1 Tax=Pseudodesulfovibrio thermohalotolerans TaxID=2880651 RepID=UPI002441A64E|nr:helix-turn-helix domain-containing protein [Pseudodesulfovibrio thermohalotolerans]WFS60994.1 helix-turn-helix domain-containing protein [Pseudodesulfovibrio thermohalotolerans]